MTSARRALLALALIASPIAACRAEPAPVVRVDAQAFALQGRAMQGGLVLGRAPEGAVRLTLDGVPLRLAPDGSFAIAFGRDAGAVSILDAQMADGSILRRPVAVEKRAFRIESIPSLAQSSEPNPEYEALRAREVATIRAARAVQSGESGWRGPWDWPATGRISGVYGSQRILGGVPRNPHYGLDIAAPTGTPVRAPADGVVTLASGPFSLEGNVVMLDHGMGLVSSFIHLSRIDVQPGQRVARGTVIGAIGTTGRSTGPHLHWGMTLWSPDGLDVRVDPQLLLPPDGVSSTTDGAAGARP